jgi:hypothetical protein
MCGIGCGEIGFGGIGCGDTVCVDAATLRSGLATLAGRESVGSLFGDLCPS